jgi:uncharacterized protein (DUF2235 family)
MDTMRGKNLVVCLDGTGNQLRVDRNTNVLRLFDMLDYSDERRQVAYYDPGVGTFSALGAWTPLGRRLTRLAGLAFGMGLRHNLGEAYLFLMRNWQPGDRIYLFGFSRGAYSVRALAGLLETVGMLHPHEENLVPYAISAYARKWSTDEQGGGSGGKAQKNLAIRFRDSFARRSSSSKHQAVRVQYLGLWDTVEASGHLRGKLGWKGVDDVPNADIVRHAVSIHERRWPYKVVPLTTPAGVTPPVVREQVWFPGVHSDVGGTFPDPQPPCRLSDITLKWVVDGALGAGLLVDGERYTAECSLYREHTEAPINSNAPLWWPLSFATRPLRSELVHASASARPGLTGRPAYADQEWWRPYGEPSGTRPYAEPSGTTPPPFPGDTGGDGDGSADRTGRVWRRVWRWVWRRGRPGDGS